jgi:hypothetical protein
MIIGSGSVMAEDSSGADTLEALKRCGAILEDAQRHACTDEVMRQNGMLAPAEARAAHRRRVFGLEVPNVPLPLHPKAPKVAKSGGATGAPGTPRAAKTPAVEEDAGQITVTLADVTVRDDGFMTFTTTEGAVWRQVESDPIRPRPVSGQQMIIERSVLGGYFCHPNKWTLFRCRQIS